MNGSKRRVNSLSERSADTRQTMLVFSFAPRGFSPGTPISPSRQKLTFLNSNSTRNGRNRTLCRCAYSKWYKQTNERNIAELPLNRYLFGRHNSPT